MDLLCTAVYPLLEYIRAPFDSASFASEGIFTVLHSQKRPFEHCRQFTDTALSFSTGILNALIDLISFSGILYTIYPPLFIALLLYSVGGTAISLQLGKPLVGLNFRQEAREADFRCDSIQSNRTPGNTFTRGSKMHEAYNNITHMHIRLLAYQMNPFGNASILLRLTIRT